MGHTARLSSITADHRHDDIVITWDQEGPETDVDVFHGLTPATIARTRPLVTVSGQGEAVIPDPDPRVRHYFELVPKGGPGIVVAARRVRLEGSVNFRDLGGYEGLDGRRVKWGQVFRSDGLTRLTDNDRDFLVRMGLRLVCDLRSTPEVEVAPDLLPENGAIGYLSLPIQTAELNFVAALERMKQGDASWLTDDFMINGYRRNIELFPHVWKTLLERVIDPETRPLAFHCTGGKDRAGTAAAIILLTLGVSEETVIEDHQKSNRYIAPLLERIYDQVEAYGIARERVRSYFTAPRDAIIALLDHIRGTYGTAQDYLVDKAGLPAGHIDRLRQALLEP